MKCQQNLESNDLNFNGRGITVGLGSLWISDALADDIHRIDPSNFNVISSFNTPGTEPNGLAFDGSNLWLVDPFFQKVYELNTSGGLISNFSVPNAGHNGLEWDTVGMWTNTGDTELSHYLPNGTISETGTLEGLPSGAIVRGVAVGNGKFFASQGDTIYTDLTLNSSPPPPPPPDPIPEPSTYLLFAVGILGILGMGWRQRKKAA